MVVNKLILFRLNEQVYGVNVESVSAIESVTEIVYVPNAPSYIEGIINLRGEIIPVYSLRKKFHLPMGEAATNIQMIITRSKEQVFAFVVDSVDEIFELSKGAYELPPKVLQTEETSYIHGIAKLENRLVISLDIDGLMSEPEKEHLKKFVEGVRDSDEE